MCVFKSDERESSLPTKDVECPPFYNANSSPLIPKGTPSCPLAPPRLVHIEFESLYAYWVPTFLVSIPFMYIAHCSTGGIFP